MGKYRIIFGEVTRGVGEKPWGVGDEIELSDENGAHMVAAGTVVKVEDPKRAPEKPKANPEAPQK